MSGTWAVGERIVHRKFGMGTIIAIDESANGPEGCVAFDAGPERRIVLDREYLRAAGEGFAAVTAAIIEPVPADDDHGHGDHWKIFFDEVKTALLRLPSFCTHATPLSPQESGKLPGLLAFRESDQRNGMVVVLRFEKDAMHVATLYPAIEVGVVHRLQVTRVEPWASGAEAHVSARWRDQVEITFFDTRYVLHGARYASQQEGEFAIAGFAYQWRKAVAGQITLPAPFKDEAARRAFLARHPDASAIFESGCAPLTASTAGAAVLLPAEHGDVDDWQIRGAVQWIYTIEMLDQPVYRIRMTVARSLDNDAPFDITLFAPARTLAGPPPVAGDDVEAAVWLIGYRMDG